MNPHAANTDDELDALAIEYRDSQDTERRNEIRLSFWVMEQEFAYTMLLRRIRQAGIPESEYAKGQALLDHKVFEEEGFNKIVNGWKPGGGRPFRNYFKWAVVRRCGDVIRKLKTHHEDTKSDTVNGPDPGHIGDGVKGASRHRASKLLNALNSLDVLLKQEHGLWEETGDEDDVSGNIHENALDHDDRNSSRNLASVLAFSLAALEEENGPRNPDLGCQARAVFELIHKAYIQPDDMSEYTRRMVETNGGCSFGRLKEEYFDDQRLQTRLDDGMATASRDIERTEFLQRAQRAKFSQREYTATQVAALESEARKRSIHKGDSSGKKGLYWTHVEEWYINICARFIRLKRVRQILLEENKKYVHAAHNSTWTRSEPEVAKMLGLSQPTVHRRLEFAEDFIRRWGHGE